MPYSPPERNSGEIFGRNVARRLMKNAAKFWRNIPLIFVLQFPGKLAHKKFHTNSSTHQDLKFHTAEPKFFDSDTLGVGGPKVDVQV